MKSRFGRSGKTRDTKIGRKVRNGTTIFASSLRISWRNSIPVDGAGLRQRCQS